jgi:sRNA-binding protein
MFKKMDKATDKATVKEMVKEMVKVENNSCMVHTVII